MNVLNKVARQSMRRNRTRTVVTVIGVMLSACMICAVTTLVASFHNYMLEYALYCYGDWHASAADVSLADCDELKDRPEIAEIACAQPLGFAEVSSRNENKPYLFVLGAQEDCLDLLPVHLTAGSYPRSTDEILLPTHLSTDGGVQYELGSRITLAIGDRMRGGARVGRREPNYDDAGEKFEERIQTRHMRSYTVVGFYERFPAELEPYSMPGYTALTLADENLEASAGVDVYFTLKKPQKTYALIRELEGRGITCEANREVLMCYGSFANGNFSATLYAMAAILIALIMFGSVSLIYNAFSISVSERTRQFGLLSSIGATKKQLRGMVFYEAFTVGAMGIPLGVAAGIAGIGVTLTLIGDKFAALLMGNYDAPLRLCVSWQSVIAAAAIALVTVLISAWIPSRRATRISAVEAIRQNEDIQIRGRRVRTSKLTYRIFGLPGMLASKNYKRNRRKYRATVLSLFMSIVLFVSASAFTEYLTEMVGGGFDSADYDLILRSYDESMEDETAREVLELIKTDPNVNQATYTRFQGVNGVIPKDQLNPEVAESLGAVEASWAGTGEYAEMGAYLFFVADESFEELLKRYNLPEEEFADPRSPRAIATNRITEYSTVEKKFVTVDYLREGESQIQVRDYRRYEGYEFAGEVEGEDGVMARYIRSDDGGAIGEMRVPVEEARIQYSLDIGKAIEERPYYAQEADTMILIYPASAYAQVISESLRGEGRRNYSFPIISRDHAASYSYLDAALAQSGLFEDYYYLYDYAEHVEMNRNMVAIIRVFSYGFIVLISLIAAANVFNTISTNIGLRRREFAMLRSVGMGQRGFNRMMNFECLLYGSKALILGIPVSCGAALLIHMAVMESYETQFKLPWRAMGIAALSVFLVVFASMMYAMHKIKGENPIDALKNENL